MNRRDLLKKAGAGIAALALPFSVFGKSKAGPGSAQTHPVEIEFINLPVTEKQKEALNRMRQADTDAGVFPSSPLKEGHIFTIKGKRYIVRPGLSDT